MATIKKQQAKTSTSLRSRLRRIRKEAGLSQAELAQRLGFAQKSSVSGIENGHRDTIVPVLEEWVRECDATLEILGKGRDCVEIAHLDSPEQSLVKRIVAVLPHLDPVLQATLRSQIALWEATAKPSTGE